MLMIFSPEKIPTASVGFEPANSGTQGREAKHVTLSSIDMKNPLTFTFPLTCASLMCCCVQHWDKFAFTLRNIIRVIKLVGCGLWSVECGGWIE
jgi:hypothetical protein